MTTADTPPPLFGTVLVARTPQDSPSPLELQMRNASGRFRIVQKLSGGAHLLLPGSETTIAIRAYFAEDLNDDDRKNSSNVNDALNMNDLVVFRNAFKYPVVFFVLPTEEQQQQLSDIHSFVNQTQLVMNNKDGTSGHQKEGCGRVFIVPNVTSAIDVLSSVVQTLTPERRDLKKQFHDSVKAKNFVQQQHDSSSSSSSSKHAAAMHVRAAFRNWANRFELPVGEADVLMSRLGSISGIGTADLSGAPLFDSTKDKLHAFFGSHPGESFQTTNPHHLTATEAMGTALRYQQGDVVSGMSTSGHFEGYEHPSNEYGTPLQDYSAMGMVPVEANDMEVSDLGAEWQGEPMRATPQLVSQQFVPRGSRHAAAAGSFARMQRSRGMDSNHHHVQQQSNHHRSSDVTTSSRRHPLASQFNHVKSNAIRPFSSYSEAAAAGESSLATHVPGYYR